MNGVVFHHTYISNKESQRLYKDKSSVLECLNKIRQKLSTYILKVKQINEKFHCNTNKHL